MSVTLHFKPLFSKRTKYRRIQLEEAMREFWELPLSQVAQFSGTFL